MRDEDGSMSFADLLRGHAARFIVPGAERAPLDPERLGIPRQPLDQTLRRAVLMRDGYRCCWCQAYGRNVLFEVDHIVPWSAGGSDHPVNLRTLCRPCNQVRSNRVSEFDQRVFPIVWRCYSCDQWGDVEEQDALITAYCTTCQRLSQNVPYVADLMFGGPVPDVGIPSLQPGDVDYSTIPLTVRPPQRRFREDRAKDDARRYATERAAARAAARAELDAVRPTTEETL